MAAGAERGTRAEGGRGGPAAAAAAKGRGRKNALERIKPYRRVRIYRERQTEREEEENVAPSKVRVARNKKMERIGQRKKKEARIMREKKKKMKETRRSEWKGDDKQSAQLQQRETHIIHNTCAPRVRSLFVNFFLCLAW